MESADSKATRIVATDLKGDFKHKEIDLNIISLSKITDGVQVFATAKKDSKPIGFGKDGTVEIERFRFVNPPTLVKDPLGPLVFTSTVMLKEGEIQITRRYRDDPEAALLKMLGETINQVGKDDSQITPGKIGNTTTTLFATDDGAINYNPVATTYALIHDAATGTAVDTASTAAIGVQIRGGVVLNTYNNLARSGFTFDTSSIPDTDTISAATFGIVGGNGLTKEETITGQTVSLVGFTPADPATYATADYDQFGTTLYADTGITITAWDTGGTNYNTWTMNATGIAAISKTGNTILGARLESDRANSAPTWASNANGAYAGFTMLISSGTTDDPKMVITHAAAGLVGVKTMDDLAIASVKTVNGLAIASVKTVNGLA